MAKKKENKSELIRSILGNHPTMTAKEVVAKLKENNVDATEGLVYAVKQKMKPTKGKTKTPKAAPATPAPTKAAPSSNGVLGVGASIALVRQTADKVGGWAALKEIVDALA